MTYIPKEGDRVIVKFVGEYHPATILGTRYFTSRNNGRTSLVADYMMDDGRQCFDSFDKFKPADVDDGQRLRDAAPVMLEALRQIVEDIDDGGTGAAVARARAIGAIHSATEG